VAQVLSLVAQWTSRIEQGHYSVNPLLAGEPPQIALLIDP
jgi:hypothetical protein